MEKKKLCIMFQKSYVRSNSTRAAGISDIISQGSAASASISNRGLSQVAAQQLTRKTKSHIQLKSSFCRIVIAISTLRTRATSGQHPKIAPAHGQHPPPLIGLFRLFLFYLAAAASVLTIIIYANHPTRPEVGLGSSALELVAMTDQINIGKDCSTTNATTDHIRKSRSIPEVRNFNPLSEPLLGTTIIHQQPVELDFLTHTMAHQDPLQARKSNSSFIVPMMTNGRPSSETRTFGMRNTYHLHQPAASTQTSRIQPQHTSHNKTTSGSGSSQSNNGETVEYSVNNRGALSSAASTSKLQVFNKNQHQWIPIVNPKLAMAEPTPPRLLYGFPNQNQFKASTSHGTLTTGAGPPQLAENMMKPSQSHPNFDEPDHLYMDVLQQKQRLQIHHQNHFAPPQPQPSHHHYYHHHHHHQHQNYANFPQPSHKLSHWRRPRLNTHYDVPPHLSKIYKVVLLCDKTLVSLDYIKRITIEPQPYHHHHHHSHDDSEFDDNDIDLESNLEPIYAASRRQGDALLNSTTTTTTTTTTTNADADDLLDKSATTVEDNHDQMKFSGSTARRSHLTEDDPLIRCDMWDLEKGLKNRKPPPEILYMAVRADFDTVRDAINRCRQLSEKMLPPDDEYRGGIEVMSTEDLISVFSMKRGLIPGTKWCGLGDMASNYNDLGPKHRIDICCRAHDHCPIRLKPFRNDYGVLNIALYTKSHCDCDADFYRCLREVRSRTADMLGNLYFNVMKLQCMREERMKICREMKPIALGFERCVRYVDNPMRTVFKFTTPPVAY